MPDKCPIRFGALHVENNKDYVKKIAAFNMLKNLWKLDCLNQHLRPKNDLDHLDNNNDHFQF